MADLAYADSEAREGGAHINSRLTYLGMEDLARVGDKETASPLWGLAVGLEGVHLSLVEEMVRELAGVGAVEHVFGRVCSDAMEGTPTVYDSLSIKGDGFPIEKLTGEVSSLGTFSLRVRASDAKSEKTVQWTTSSPKNNTTTTQYVISVYGNNGKVSKPCVVFRAAVVLAAVVSAS